MQDKLTRYANLAIYQGVALKKGEMLTISAPTVAADLVEQIVETAYAAGAVKVMTIWKNDNISRLNYLNQSIEELSTIPDYAVAQTNYSLDRKSCYIAIISDDPEVFSDVPPEKIASAIRANAKANKRFRESTSSNRTRWSLFAYPNLKWAKKVFPDLNDEAALEKLWDYILKTAHLDNENYLESWSSHQEDIHKRCEYLNNAKIKSFRYKNGIGTDFSIGMTKGYLFCGGSESGPDGIPFSANIPTEEVFSSPDRNTANGKLVSAMPLIYQGNIIDKFSLSFENGRIVDFTAEKGYETLKNIIEADEGSHYLGEIALIGYNSAISNLKTLFYSTLFDENASCHFAIGNCYSGCMKDSENMTEEQLLECGLNNSLVHVDFMVGTADLDITAETVDGKTIQIFKNGDWVL